NILKYRYHNYSNFSRLAVEFQSSPDYQFYFPNSEKLIINLFNTKINKQKLKGKYPGEKLLKSIIFNTLKPNKTSLEINLNYFIPKENIKIFTLKNPMRLVIDFYKNYQKEFTYQITPNIKWIKKEIAQNGSCLLFNELWINKNSKAYLKISRAFDKNNTREKTSSMAKRKNALAAINGGFFLTKGGAAGLVILEGKIITPPSGKRPPRTALGITSSGLIIIDKIILKDNKIYGKDTSWENVKEAIGAGPRLIKNGKIFLTIKEEAFGEQGNNITKPAARSALGITENQILILTVSGFRSNHTQGIKLPLLAEYLKNKNIKEAINLDGGNSTTLVIKNKIVSFPPAGKNKKERKVATAILIFDDNDQILLPQEIKISILKNVLSSTNIKGKNTLNLEAEILDSKGNPVIDQTPIILSANSGEITPETAYTKEGKINFTLKSSRSADSALIKIQTGTIEKTLKINFKK
ncbi:MAG: phosphodiester glycosidase family protein, partial [Armatimonadetes bacterium]|nr:phosphodiester glycosidase family protein [Armatimonadota bacterium]